jgi:tRNA(Ile)-lysidine synthase
VCPGQTAPANDGPLTLGEVAPLLEPYLSGGKDGVVLAVSGGPDSVALMRFAAAMTSARQAAPPTVATIDHGLRRESKAEAELVAGWARACGLPHRVLAWTGPKPSAGRQAAAREARYRLLAELARALGAPRVLTAHHGDDQAETVLMRLCRGSGPAGLAGMDRETVLHGAVVARPFLGVRKARLVASCRAEGWPFLDDPGNADPDFARTRLRRLLPLLEAEGLTPERLARLAGRLRRWREVVEREADRAFDAAATGEGGLIALDGARLVGEPDEVIAGTLFRAVGAVAPDGRHRRLERLEALAAALAAALRRGVPFRANLGGALVESGPDRRVLIRPEPTRQPRRPAALGTDAAGPPHSLGTDSGGP